MFSLSQNYANPFNPFTAINYTLAKKMRVTLTVFNLLGQKVKILADEIKPAGSYGIIWDGRDAEGHQVPSGIYFYQLKTDQQALAKKMVMLK